jgi:hypothetical protein
MTKFATNPLIVIALGLLLGVGTGLGWFWKAAVPLVQQARELRFKKVEGAKPDAPWDFWTIEIENLASELKDTKSLMKKREEEIAARESRLAAEKEEMVKQRREIEALRAEISTQMLEIQADETKNLKSLAGIYSNLTPKATLAIFKEMDDTAVVKLLSLMKADVVSPLFEEMGKQAVSDPVVARRAASLSEKLRLVKINKPGATP